MNLIDNISLIVYWENIVELNLKLYTISSILNTCFYLDKHHWNYILLTKF